MRQYESEGWYCANNCNNNRGFFKDTLSFHCHKCRYDLCLNCVKVHNYKYINDQTLQKAPKGTKVYVSGHPDYLMLSDKQERNYNVNTWKCSICGTEAPDSIYSFHCHKCNYDVCLKCFGQHKENRQENDSCCIIY